MTAPTPAERSIWRPRATAKQIGAGLVAGAGVLIGTLTAANQDLHGWRFLLSLALGVLGAVLIVEAANRHGERAAHPERIYAVGGSLVVLAFALALVPRGLGIGTKHNLPPVNGVMSGELNVAVTAFTSHGNQTSDGAALALHTARALQSNLRGLDPSMNIEVRGPDELRGLGGSGPEDQTRAAATLASQVHADVIVYGDLEVSPGGTQLTPAFFVKQTALPSASELAGPYGYGKPIALPYSIDASPESRAELRRDLLVRTEYYAAAFLGVGYYLTHQLRTAARYFQRALASSRGAPSAPLLELFLGNIANQSGQPSLANHYYTTASQDKVIHARAQLGLAKVAYQTSHGRCARQHTNPSGLLRARNSLARLPLTALVDPSIKARIDFTLGQIDLCLSAAQASARWVPARQEFTAVIEAYRLYGPELRDDAAEAHAGLGLIDLMLGSVTRHAYLAARREYQAAADTTTIGPRHGLYLGIVGFVSERLGDFAAAGQAYQHASDSATDAISRRRFALDAARAARHR